MAAILGHRYGLNAKMFGFKNVLAVLQSEAIRNGRKIEIRRLAYYDRGTNQLYVSRFNGEFYRLNGASIEQPRSTITSGLPTTRPQSHLAFPTPPSGEDASGVPDAAGAALCP